jgi:hypothetical protein
MTSCLQPKEPMPLIFLLLYDRVHSERANESNDNVKKVMKKIFREIRKDKKTLPLERLCHNGQGEGAEYN